MEAEIKLTEDTIWRPAKLLRSFNLDAIVVLVERHLCLQHGKLEDLLLQDCRGYFRYLVVRYINVVGLVLQLRRQARLRREYLYRKGVEERERNIQNKKDRLKRAVEDNRLIDGDLRRDAMALAKSAKWDDAGPEAAEAAGSGAGGVASKSSQDDEYRWAGVEDPKVMITTSRDPSARLKKFAKV